MSAVLGLSILAAFYAFAYWLIQRLSKALKAWRWKWIALAPLILLLLLLPWADEFYIAYRFAKLCENAGVHVVRKVEVEGFYDSTLRSGYELINKYGYAFMEHPSIDRTKVEHIEKVNGEWRKTVLDRPTARFIYRFTDPRQEIPIGYRLEKRETVIVDSETREIIARDTRYHRYPGWVQSLWVQLLGSDQTTCLGPTPDSSKPRLLDHHVFVPVTKKQ